MSPLSSADIRGNWATLLLPLNADESIDFGKLAAQIDRIIAFKVDGIYSNGTAGEFYSQTEEDFDRISELLAEKCRRAKMPFQIGCSHMSPQLSVQRVRRAVSLRPGAIQVILPDWYPPSISEIIDFLRVIAEAAAPVGLVLYNPPHAKKRLTPADYAQIAAAGLPVVGCKTAGGDEKWYQEMKGAAPDLSLFVPGHRLASGRLLGAQGAYSNMACLHPGAAQRWYELMKTDTQAALELEGRIKLFMEEYILPFIGRDDYSNQAVDKLLAAAGGWTELSPRLRWPYRWIDERHISGVRAGGRKLIPEFFDKG